MGDEAGRRRLGRLIPGRGEGAETCTSAGRSFPRWQSANQHRSCAMGEVARFGRNRGGFSFRPWPLRFPALAFGGSPPGIAFPFDQFSVRIRLAGPACPSQHRFYERGRHPRHPVESRAPGPDVSCRHGGCLPDHRACRLWTDLFFQAHPPVATVALPAACARPGLHGVAGAADCAERIGARGSRRFAQAPRDGRGGARGGDGGPGALCGRRWARAGERAPTA